MNACATAERCITHFDQPDSAISCIHYERLIRVRLCIVVILLVFGVEWLLLVFYGGFVHFKNEKVREGWVRAGANAL